MHIYKNAILMNIMRTHAHTHKTQASTHANSLTHTYASIQVHLRALIRVSVCVHAYLAHHRSCRQPRIYDLLLFLLLLLLLYLFQYLAHHRSCRLVVMQARILLLLLPHLLFVLCSSEIGRSTGRTGGRNAR